MDTKNKKNGKAKASPCESCAYYDVTDEDGTLGCVIDVDEDEAYAEALYAQTARHRSGSCPYYKFYDEYKSVQKQN